MQRLFTWFDGDLQIVKRGQVVSCSICQNPIPKTACYVYLKVENMRICKQCIRVLGQAFDWIEERGMED